MHETETLGSMWRRLAVPSGWVYWSAGETDKRFVPDDYADHVIEYRKAQAEKHKIPLPEYMRPTTDGGFCQSDAQFIADIAVALEVDPEASFDVIYDRAREVMDELRELKDVPEVDDGAEL